MVIRSAEPLVRVCSGALSTLPNPFICKILDLRLRSIPKIILNFADG
jgi:hypothetical protein